MTTLLVKNIHTLATFDAEQREIRRGALFVRDHVIEQVGTTDALPDTADEVLDLGDRHVVLPGLVNTHHHFFQSLTRAVPAAQNRELFGWLNSLYPLWSNITASMLQTAAQMSAAELILSGCTTASDHSYLFPNDCTLDDEIRAIQAIGLRFQANRGSMSIGESKGGLPPDHLVESEAFILRDSQRLIEQYHDNDRYAMLRITLAPCSPFTVSPALMRESAAMARTYPGVRLHTHLAENISDVNYSLEKFGQIPGEYAESVGWLGDDVWHAHCVKLSDRSLTRFGETGTGVAHCPCSNMRLASGIAPIRTMLDRRIPVGLGVDGSASNDTGHLMQEARMAMLAARVRDEAPGALTAREALAIATTGGAQVLGRDDIGAIAPNMAADFIAINLDRPALAGAGYDPVAALLFFPVHKVNYSFIKGRRVVDKGRLTTLDLPKLIQTHRQATETLMNSTR